MYQMNPIKAMMMAQPDAYRFFSIDVEAVATGVGHHDRSVAQISLIDQYEQVGFNNARGPHSGKFFMPFPIVQPVLNAYVKPDLPVVSYLTALTGLTEQTIQVL
jgi:RNA exonuclease 4